MSATAKSADDVMKLLDGGQTVVLRKNGLGTYTAVAVKASSPAACELSDAIDKAVGWDGDSGDENGDDRDFGDPMPGVVETDDFTPSQALYRVTEKATTGRTA
jgi:hypothetical protein